MVNWEPYNALLNQIPCKLLSRVNDERGVWLARVPLVHFWIIEHYYPDRVMRQFGYAQPLPPPLVLAIDYHASSIAPHWDKDADKGLASVFVVSDRVQRNWDPHSYHYIGSVEGLASLSAWRRMKMSNNCYLTETDWELSARRRTPMADSLPSLGLRGKFVRRTNPSIINENV
ncbi:uncharacterized protein LOC144544141 [Carex rostrata]